MHYNFRFIKSLIVFFRYLDNKAGFKDSGQNEKKNISFYGSGFSGQAGE